MSIQSKLANGPTRPGEETRRGHSGYRRLRRFSILLTSLVALTPLIIMIIVNYHQDQEIYRAESRFVISQVLSNTKRSLESVVKERLSALSLIVDQQSFENLLSDEGLKLTLTNLKNSFGGFVDLGIIDKDGNQLFYVGPYNLQGKNYRDQSWFHEVCLREKFVSDVFMGYRNFPHFIIASKHENPQGEFYVLRATIDMEFLYDQIYVLNLDRSTDAFIINRKGVLQTSSIYYGDLLTETDIEVPPYSRNREVVEEYEESGRRITLGYAYIEKTPFILLVMKQMENPIMHWIQHRSVLMWFLVGSVILIIIATFYVSNRMVNRVREADMRRARAFHNIEYTNKMATIGRMAASVAHEINNPLAIINEKAGLLKDMVNFAENYPQKEKTLKLAESITKSVVRCSDVTHRLLGFAKRMDFRRELIDLQNLMKEVVGFLGKEVQHRSIEVTYNFPEDMPALESDRGQLQQIFLNVINNAFAAMDDGGKLDISAAKIDNKAVTVAITDNGKGIPEEDLKNIFEPFFSTKGEFGTGLGLSITREIVNKLGGQIFVESELGEGTRFIITFPLDNADYLE